MAAMLLGTATRKNIFQHPDKASLVPPRPGRKWLWMLALVVLLIGGWLWNKPSMSVPLQASVPSRSVIGDPRPAPPMPLFPPRWLSPESVDKRPLYCERAQSIMSHLCLDQKQEDVCWDLYNRADSDSFQQRFWLQKYLALQQQACDEPKGRLAACWNLLNTTDEGSSEWSHAKERLVTLLAPLCQQEPNARTCMDLYKLAPADSPIRADARERFLELTQKPCDAGDRYTCFELLDQADASLPEKIEGLKRFYAMSLMACETGDITGCGGMIAAHSYENKTTEALELPLPTEQQLAVYHRMCEEGSERMCWESSLLATNRTEEYLWEAKAARLAEKYLEKKCTAGSMEDCKQATDKQFQERYLAWATKQCSEAEDDTVCASLYIEDLSDGVSILAQQQNDFLREKYVTLHQPACENGDKEACRAMQFAFPKDSQDRAYWTSRSDRLYLFECASGKHRYCDVLSLGFAKTSQEDQDEILALGEATCSQVGSEKACLFVADLYKHLGSCKFI